MSDENKEKIIKKIKALMEKTVENGCTENEAILAAEKVKQLLDEYELNTSELEIKNSIYTENEINIEIETVLPFLIRIAIKIAKLTKTRFWYQDSIRKQSISFFGIKHETQLAEYLLNICKIVLINESKNIDEQTRIIVKQNIRRRKKISLLEGITQSICTRIENMLNKTTGTGLVVVREKEIEKELKKLNINIKPKDIKTFDYEEELFNQGKEIGNSVNLTTGIGEERNNNLIDKI